MSWIQIAHELPGRTRFRSPVLRRDEHRCERLADALVEVPGVRTVAARPYTGSVLIEHDRTTTAQTLVEAAARELGVAVLPRGAPPPMPATVPPFSAVAHKLVLAFRDIDRDIRRSFDGSVDLGTLVTLGLFGAGAAEIAVSGQLPLPPWFNLAWWGFRTFVTTEQEEMAAEIAAELED
jgi:heavy-metal-associated domain-containing protein